MVQFIKSKYLFIAILFSLISVIPLLHSGLPPTHDGEYHVVRFYEFDKAIRDGDWFPRWASDLNNGYGIPLFNFVYPLPNYSAFFFHLFGLSFIDAFKLSMIVSAVLGGIFFFLWSREYWGDLGGLVSSVFYTFSPYHFVDVYIRGSVGEVWSLGLFPVFLWSITGLIKNSKKKYIIPSIISLTCIILAHNILALIFFFFAISYIVFLLFRQKERRRFALSAFFVIILSLGLSSIFWLPALLEKNYTLGLQIFDIKDTFPEIYQLIFPSWGSGFADSKLGEQMSFQIGVANLFAVLLSFIPLFVSFKKKSHSFIIIFSLGWFFLIFFLMTSFSSFVWDNIPLMNYFQFPWRLLSLEILISSFLAGTLIKVFNLKKLAAFMIIFSFALSLEYVKVAYYLERQDSYYTTKSNFIDGTNSPANMFNTLWMNRDLKKEKEKIKIISGDAQITKFDIKTSNYKFNIISRQGSKILINTAYFPGWIAFIDGRKIDLLPNKDGIISFVTPRGEHLVEVKFADTFVRSIAKGIFYVSLVILLALFMRIYNVRIKR